MFSCCPLHIIVAGQFNASILAFPVLTSDHGTGLFQITFGMLFVKRPVFWDGCGCGRGPPVYRLPFVRSFRGVLFSIFKGSSDIRIALNIAT
jgi:hypothetical protein